MKNLEDKTSRFISKNLIGLKPKGTIECFLDDTSSISCKSSYSSGLLSRSEQKFFENLSEKDSSEFLNMVNELIQKSSNSTNGSIRSCLINFNSIKFEFSYY